MPTDPAGLVSQLEGARGTKLDPVILVRVRRSLHRVVADRRPVGQPARDIEQQRRQVGHEIVTPLSTGSTWPVTMRDSSLAR